MAMNAPAAAPAVPADVAAFAAEHGLTAYVDPIVQMTRRVFAGALVEPILEEDAEELGVYSILMRVDVTG